MRNLQCIFLCILLCGCANQLFLHPGLSKTSTELSDYPDFQGRKALSSSPLILENGERLQLLHYTPENPVAAVMVSGGNAASLSEVIYYHRYLLNQNIQVTFFSFQGFDKSTGEASLATMINDAQQVLARQRLHHPQVPHFYISHSLSTAVGLCLSQGYGLDGVILESTLDINNVVDYHARNSALSWVLSPFASLTNASLPEELTQCNTASQTERVQAMFIHHRQDTLTPFNQAVEIYRSYEGEKQFIEAQQSLPPQYHQSVWYDPKIQSAILSFISQ